jgi:hypothetical protein
MVNWFRVKNVRPFGKPDLSSSSFPTFFIGHLSWPRLRMDPRYQLAGMTERICHAGHFLSGIYLDFASDGSPLPTGGDDDSYAFGLDRMLNVI